MQAPVYVNAAPPATCC